MLCEVCVLFDQVVKYLQVNGEEKVWVVFSDLKGFFVKKDFYVYVIDCQGIYVVNGVVLDSLIGFKVFDSVDVVGKLLFCEMIVVIEKQLEVCICYVWFNCKSNKVQLKVVWVYCECEYILGVGYYVLCLIVEDV